MEDTDYYQVLGVDRDDDPKSIKDAYRKLAFEYHPDRNTENPNVLEKMKAINEAYAVLSDPAKRRRYDSIRQQYGSSAYSRFRQSYTEQDIFSGSDIFQVFEEMTRAFGFRGFDDIFKEFYGEGYRSFEFRRPGYYARGFVFTGGSAKRKPHGQPPINGPFGKMSKFLLEKISGITLPETGKDIHDTIRLSPGHAAEGGPYAYYHRKRDKKLIVNIPKGVQSGQRIRLSGLGETGKGGAVNGDLYLRVQIQQPILRSLKDGIGKLFR
ncbi:hypothetical protein D3OALGA1CA_5604 [Olavius algarvensis associated proteobacterium Delta 3]|nr:hypothetical protein D3OALGB2SA_5382 [Olavius algarvensis associated proteobacterium Delta 3]CAB5169067.1 hypothetical protein D3OALGA1CA_5604 [Olavius algarvensis associated proteobacterium Delta 3]